MRDDEIVGGSQFWMLGWIMQVECQREDTRSQHLDWRYRQEGDRGEKMEAPLCDAHALQQNRLTRLSQVVTHTTKHYCIWNRHWEWVMRRRDAFPSAKVRSPH